MRNIGIFWTIFIGLTIYVVIQNDLGFIAGGLLGGTAGFLGGLLDDVASRGRVRK